jgi:hypothetical protein
MAQIRIEYNASGTRSHGWRTAHVDLVALIAINAVHQRTATQGIDVLHHGPIRVTLRERRAYLQDFNKSLV